MTIHEDHDLGDGITGRAVNIEMEVEGKEEVFLASKAQNDDEMWVIQGLDGHPAERVCLLRPDGGWSQGMNPGMLGMIDPRKFAFESFEDALDALREVEPLPEPSPFVNLQEAMGDMRPPEHPEAS